MRRLCTLISSSKACSKQPLHIVERSLPTSSLVTTKHPYESRWLFSANPSVILQELSTKDHKAEVFQVSNDDTAVAQRRLKDKQPEEKTNTNRLVKEREKVHLGIKVGANITVTRVPSQEGAEGNVAEKKKGVYES
ncbi:hypothetical protein Tco_1196333 [Tanacetum coccineum]